MPAVAHLYYTTANQKAKDFPVIYHGKLVDVHECEEPWYVVQCHPKCRLGMAFGFGLTEADYHTIEIQLHMEWLLFQAGNISCR